MQLNLDFQDHHVFVFGGTTGINFGIANAFARCGARVSVASRQRENVDAALAAQGAQAQGECADVRDFDAMGTAFQNEVRRFGPIDGTEVFRKQITRTEEELALAESAVSLRRFGTTNDIAHLALFLTSPYVSYISGTVISCDGGGDIDSVKPALVRAGMQRSAFTPAAGAAGTCPVRHAGTAPSTGDRAPVQSSPRRLR